MDRYYQEMLRQHGELKAKDHPFVLRWAACDAIAGATLDEYGITPLEFAAAQLRLRRKVLKPRAAIGPIVDIDSNIIPFPKRCGRPRLANPKSGAERARAFRARRRQELTVSKAG